MLPTTNGLGRRCTWLHPIHITAQLQPPHAPNIDIARRPPTVPPVRTPRPASWRSSPRAGIRLSTTVSALVTPSSRGTRTVALDGHSATGSRLGVHQFSRSAAAEPSTCQTRNRFRAWPIAVRHPHNHVTCNAQTDRRLTSTLLRSRSDLSIPLEVGVRVGVP